MESIKTNLNRTRREIIRLFALLCILTLPLPSLAFDFFGSDCPDVEQKAKPDWVKGGATYLIDGYNTGYGVSKFKKNKGYHHAENRALKNALASLGKTIQVSVEADVFSEDKLIENDGDKNVESEFVNRIKTSTNVDLAGVGIYRRWQNPKNCKVHVLVRLEQSKISLIWKKNQADEFFKIAQDTNLTIDERQAALKEAVLLAANYDFGKLEGSKSSKQLLREFERLSDELEQKKAKHNNAVALINKTGQVDRYSLSPIDSVLKAIPGSFELNQECSSTVLCLQKANKTMANYASIAEVSFKDLNRLNGFWQGFFSVSLHLKDLKSNKDIVGFRDLRVKVMNRSKHKITVDNSMKKWLLVHEKQLQEFQNVSASLN